MAGVLAFLLGIGFTLLMQRIRKKITEREIRRSREDYKTDYVVLRDRQIMAVSGGNEEEAQLKKE